MFFEVLFLDVIKKGAITWSLITILGLSILYLTNNKNNNAYDVEGYSLERQITGLYVKFEKDGRELKEKLDVPFYLTSYPLKNTTVYITDLNNDGLKDLVFKTEMPFESKTIVYFNNGSKPYFKDYKEF